MDLGTITTPPSKFHVPILNERDLIAFRVYIDWLKSNRPLLQMPGEPGVILERAVVKDYITLCESSGHTFFSKSDISNNIHGWGSLLVFNNSIDPELVNLALTLAYTELFPKTLFPLDVSEIDLEILMPRASFIALLQEIISQFEFFYRLHIGYTQRKEKDDRACAKIRMILCLPTCGISMCCDKVDFEIKYLDTYDRNACFNRIAYTQQLQELVKSAVNDFITPNPAPPGGALSRPTDNAAESIALKADTPAVSPLPECEDDLPSYASATIDSSFA